MHNVVQLWNPSSASRLRRHWVSFYQRIVVSGDAADDTAELSIAAVAPRELRISLRAAGGVLEKRMLPGEDIQIHLRNSVLVVDVKAVDCARALVEFVASPGCNISVTDAAANTSNLLSA